MFVVMVMMQSRNYEWDAKNRSGRMAFREGRMNKENFFLLTNVLMYIGALGIKLSGNAQKPHVCCHSNEAK